MLAACMIVAKSESTTAAVPERETDEPSLFDICGTLSTVSVCT